METHRQIIITGVLAVPALISAGLYTQSVSAYTTNENGITFASCSDLQEAVNTVSGTVALTENCNINLVIPENKTLTLTTNPGLYSTDYTDTVLLSDNGGDTITIPQSAELLLEYTSISNDTNGKAILNNAGTVFIHEGYLNTGSNSITVKNTGDFNINYSSVKNFNVQNSGDLRVAAGFFDTNAAEDYLVAGVTLSQSNEDTTVLTTLGVAQYYVARGSTPDVMLGNNLDEVFPGTEDPEMEVGDTALIEFDYPDYAYVNRVTLTSSEEAVMSVTGSALTGFSIEALNTGDTVLELGTAAMGSMYGTVHVIDPQSGTGSEASDSEDSDSGDSNPESDVNVPETGRNTKQDSKGACLGLVGSILTGIVLAAPFALAIRKRITNRK